MSSLIIAKAAAIPAQSAQPAKSSLKKVKKTLSKKRKIGERAAKLEKLLVDATLPPNLALFFEDQQIPLIQPQDIHPVEANLPLLSQYSSWLKELYPKSATTYLSAAKNYLVLSRGANFSQSHYVTLYGRLQKAIDIPLHLRNKAIPILKADNDAIRAAGKEFVLLTELLVFSSGRCSSWESEAVQVSNAVFNFPGDKKKASKKVPGVTVTVPASASKRRAAYTIQCRVLPRGRALRGSTRH